MPEITHLTLQFKALCAYNEINTVFFELAGLSRENASTFSVAYDVFQAKKGQTGVTKSLWKIFSNGNSKIIPFKYFPTLFTFFSSSFFFYRQLQLHLNIMFRITGLINITSKTSASFNAGKVFSR